MMKKYDKSFFLQILGAFGLVNTFTAKGFSETIPVMHLNKNIFQSEQLQ